MTLVPGTRFAEYDIVGLLGTGGMGEVYRAHDSRLHRAVALKVLPHLAAAAPDRLARLQREAQLLAALNHPNIAAIHGLQEHAGVTALILELVEGPTLADLLAHGRMPLSEALDVGRQLATALECAHERGIVHRDVKPANIKRTHDGHVKVLDFGLAKALEFERESPEDRSATTTADFATNAGVILGTAPYMSPEQAKGHPVDRRTDIWSFGCVLYEMLVGSRAFEGHSFSELLAAILTHDIDLSRVPGDTPSSVRTLLRRCLDRDPKQRLRDIGEARIVLERPDQPDAPPPQIAGLPRATWLAACVACGLLVGALATWVRIRPPSSEPEVPMHLLMSVAPAERLAGNAYKRPTLHGFAIAPSGRFVVFGGSKGDAAMIYRRRLADAIASPIIGSEGGSFPFLSPDERWVGYWSHNTLFKVPIEGGTASTICTLPTDGTWAFAGASWGANGVIVIGLERGPLWQVPEGGGAPRHLTELDVSKHEASHRLPHHLPGGRGLLFTATSGELELGRIAVVAAASQKHRVIVENAADARYVQGRLLYARNASLFAVPFDPERLAVTGNEIRFLDQVMHSVGDDNPAVNTGAAQFDVSESGIVIYAEGGTVPPHMNRLMWTDRHGHVTSLGDAAANLLGARLSADGKSIAVALINNEREPIRIYDLERGGFTALPGVQGEAVFPVWTPDSRGVVFGWNRRGQTSVYAVPLDGSAVPRRITHGATTEIPADVTADGRWVAYIRMSPDTGMDIYLAPLDGSGQVRPLVATSADDAQPAFSRDGRWLAYASNLTGEMQVFITSFPGPGARLQVSTTGGVMPIWSSDGNRLAYVTQGTLVEATVRTGPLRVGPSSTIMRFDYLVPRPTRSHDAAPDGQRFLVTTWESRPDHPVTSLQVMLNGLGGLPR